MLRTASAARLRNWAGLLGSTWLVAEAGFKGVADGEPHLVGDHAVGVIGLLDRRMEQLDDIDQGEDAGDEEDQPGDGQNEFGLQAHGHRDRNITITRAGVGCIP